MKRNGEGEIFSWKEKITHFTLTLSPSPNPGYLERIYELSRAKIRIKKDSLEFDTSFPLSAVTHYMLHVQYLALII